MGSPEPSACPGWGLCQVCSRRGVVSERCPRHTPGAASPSPFYNQGSVSPGTRRRVAGPWAQACGTATPMFSSRPCRPWSSLWAWFGRELAWVQMPTSSLTRGLCSGSSPAGAASPGNLSWRKVAVGGDGRLLGLFRSSLEVRAPSPADCDWLLSLAGTPGWRRPSRPGRSTSTPCSAWTSPVSRASAPACPLSFGGPRRLGK